MSENVDVVSEDSEVAVAEETVAEPSQVVSSVVDEGSDEKARASRKFRDGVVVSTAMDKTIVVAITERVRHRRYQRTVQRTKKLYVDDQEGSAKLGDSVRVVETRPLSKLKRWRLLEVLERAR
ncbi:MAG: 30S ribosomal protein S17 [Acidimicrobiales bacterium]